MTEFLKNLSSTEWFAAFVAYLLTNTGLIALLIKSSIKAKMSGLMAESKYMSTLSAMDEKHKQDLVNLKAEQVACLESFKQLLLDKASQATQESFNAVESATVKTSEAVEQVNKLIVEQAEISKTDIDDLLKEV